MIHWLLHALGIDTQQSYNYDFVSGVGPMLLVLLGYAGVIRRINCHQQRCWRIGRYHVAGGQYTVCRKHHPDDAIRNGLRAHHIRIAHEAHTRQR